MAFLKDFMDCNQSLEGLDFIGEYGLPKKFWISWDRLILCGLTYTFIPCQNDPEFLWSHVYTMQLRTCFPGRL